ncbi:DUF2771 family protein [Actinokineospora sp.]|uniref:DUF2771 family protein n=1 Tax=Actinokineospora sp. TaxID=1872133 RepID=UPI004037C495
MRRALIAVLACAVVGLAGCAAPPPPEVTFFADGETARTAPQVFCEIGATACLRNDDAAAELRIRKGRPVQVSVPSDVAQSPWGVVFSYLDRDGQRVDASSRIIFPRENQLAYTLRLPDNAERLLFAGVQKLAVANGDQLLVSGYWMLKVNT